MPPVSQKSVSVLLAAKQFREAIDELQRVARQLCNAPPDDDTLDALLKLASSMDRVPLEEFRAAGFIVKKMAVLPGYTTGFITSALRAQLLPYRIFLQTMEAGFGTFAQAALTADETISQFAPDLCYLCAGTDHLGFSNVEEETERWLNLFASCGSNYGCAVIANTFVAPAHRTLGNLELRLGHSASSYVERLNAALLQRAGSQTHFCDVNFLASYYGLRTFRSESLYHSSKLPVALEYVPAYARSLATIVAALYGGTKKCLVLDLDNTLWGGVVGDDGVAGIAVGPGTQDGEAFAAFQRYILSLKKRGVLLAVASKNAEERAKEPFVVRDDMVLRLDDFSCFVANWEPKDANLRAIARAMNIGLDSMVFVDDNPVERERIRTAVPEVTVLELPENPSEYVDALANSGWFETVSVTAEDLDRTNQYRANIERDLLEHSASSYGDYLASLQMRAVIAEVDDLNLGRSTQLINKTNQFNLTTRRYTEKDVREMMTSPTVITRYLKLRDRFGDNGLVAVIIGRQESATELEIDSLLMSCRVLKRNAEFALVHSLLAEAHRRGIQLVKGCYLPTAKNAMVKDLLPTMGFSLVEETSDGRSRWALQLTTETLAAAADKAQFIESVSPAAYAANEDRR